MPFLLLCWGLRVSPGGYGPGAGEAGRCAEPAQVMAYLNAQKIAHSPYRRDATMGNTIEAAMQVKTTRALVNPNYSVVFRFDDHNSLTAYEVQYLGYIGG